MRLWWNVHLLMWSKCNWWLAMKVIHIWCMRWQCVYIMNLSWKVLPLVICTFLSLIYTLLPWGWVSWKWWRILEVDPSISYIVVNEEMQIDEYHNHLYRRNIYTSAKHINITNYIGVICIGKEYSKQLNTL